jgi:cytidyltransferase-like protein
METLVMVSGYFNPIHIGHVRMLKAAKELGDKLIVIVNNDVQQKLKKGKIIMQEQERLEVVKAMRYVDEAMIAIDDDPTVLKSIEAIARRSMQYKLIFANGGDRKDPSLIPEVPVCEKYGITMEFGVGGNDKPNSSSNINKLLGRE